MTAASSSVEQVGVPYIRLKIVSRNNNNNNKEAAYLELSLDQFYNFLHELGKNHMKIQENMYDIPWFLLNLFDVIPHPS